MSLNKLIQYLLSRWTHRGKAEFGYGAIISRAAKFEGGNRIGKGTTFSGEMGLCSYIGTNCNISGQIGRFTSIAANCKVLHGTHAYTYPYVSTSPVFYSLGKQTTISFAQRQMLKEQKYVDEVRKIMVRIGNDCWINSDVKIISGVTIGDGAVVLAGAVVSKDVPPYAIVGGVPARVMKYRYSEDDIALLLKTKWWEKDTEWIKDNWLSFCDMDSFKIILEKKD